MPNKEAYLYDGHGRRVQTTKIDGSKTLWQYSQSGQMLFSWNGPTSEKTHENIYLGGSLVATVDHDWPSNTVIATKYQHTDALGSPVAVIDAAGAVIDRTNYEPYGAAINKPAYDGIGYTGHVMDGATGLTYMQQRYYDPTCGCFLSVDPVTAYSSGDWRYFNRYAYAFNNPYTFIDPDGRQNGRANPNPSYMGLTKGQREQLVGIIAKKYGVNTAGIDVHAPAGGAGAIPTAQGLVIFEGQFVTESTLAASLGQEFEVHYLRQIFGRNEGYGASDEGEVEAYEYNIENAKRFGNTPEEVERFKGEVNRYKDRIRQREERRERERKREPEREPERREHPERVK